MDDFTTRSRRSAGAGHEADGEITRDLSALVSETSTDVPPVGPIVQRARNRAASRAGSSPMAAIRFLWMRPLFSTLAAVALGLIVAFGLPISFEKTVGADVAMTLSGPGLDGERVAAVAREMKSLLDADAVRVEAHADGSDTIYELSAAVAGRHGASVRTAAEGLASALTAAGYTAHAVVTPRTERVSGTMVAYAADRVIRISMDGKSSSQVEAEIRNALLAAGMTDANVSVSQESDGQTKVEIGVEQHAEPGSAVEMPEIVLTKDGSDLSGAGDTNQARVRIEKVRAPDGTETLKMDFSKDGRSTTCEVPNIAGKSDSDLRFEIQSQLDRAGIDARVDVLDGKVTVEAR